MAKKIVKCLFCGESFDRNSIKCEKIGNRYAHSVCYEKNKVEHAENEKWRILLEEYIVKLYGQILPLHRKQIKTLLDARLNYSTIYKTLYYFYDIQKNTTEKSVGIGIVPYAINDARAYYKTLAETEERAKRLNSISTDTINRTVHIKSPKTKRKGLKIVDLDFWEGVQDNVSE